MKIAIIGQSLFASSVYNLLRDSGHEIVGVFTIPDDSKGKEDPLALAAKSHNVPVFKFPRWRLKGQVIPEVLQTYSSVEAELNILPYCSQFIPMEVINYPKHKSICYHPSLLPKHRGAASINWTLISGGKKGGFTIFWPDDGLDTGPILLQKEVLIEENDTVETLYTRFLFPEGVEAFGEAVDMIDSGTAPKIIQTEVGASYEPMLNTPESSRIKFKDLSGAQLHNFIRGCDKIPGAWIKINEEVIKVHGSSIWYSAQLPTKIREYDVEDMGKCLVHAHGMILFGNDKKGVNVTKLTLGNGKMVNASKYGLDEESKLSLGDLTEDEEKSIQEIRSIWETILGVTVESSTDFFAAGASSMDVTRMIDNVRESLSVEIENSLIYMNSSFEDFFSFVILSIRGISSTLNFTPVTLTLKNKRTVSFPTQLFINNQFLDSGTGETLPIINPADESLICSVSAASSADVDKAVSAALVAFEGGEWAEMSARERGKLLFKLADLMEAHREELASIESLDSGAVYSLALKTHVGMSIETWRYFGGWCDKIQGRTIPISHARPSKNLCLTKREPIGVCGIVIPWNYPLMMLSWKMAACLAAGNTVIVKPAQVCPLTALKFAELSVRAGFPPGVISVLPGSGSVVGAALSQHPEIRKLGFTGSTPIGKIIMSSCADSNVKRVSLELGGKSPLVIFADCDLDKAVRNALSAVFFNKGENCIAAGRLFVEDAILPKFLRKVVSETKKIVTGDPLDRSTSHGPQNHLAHLEKLIEFCEKGVKEGAKLEYGGHRISRPGFFFSPTIFSGVEDHMFIAHEESFGPIMIISSFPTGDIYGVLKRVNATEFGLASGVFTKDINKALRVSEKIHAGTCFINCYNKTDVGAPFGGFKQSGFGKDLGEEALNEYLRTKTITIEY